MSFILQKTQNALVEAILAQGWTWATTVRAEISRGPKDEDSDAAPASNELPSILVSTPTATQYHPNVANFEVEVAVMVRHQADDTAPADHLTRAAQVSDWILGDSFFSDINAHDGFTAHGKGLMSQDLDRVGRLWQTTFRFPLSASPSTIT